MNSLCGKYHASKLANYPLHIEKNNGNTSPVMVALLYGSWNVKLSNTLKEKDTLPWSKIYDALETCNVDATSATDIRNIPCVYTKVDEDDESVDICVNILECPSELPALVFLCNTTPLSTTTSEVKSQGLRVEHVEFNSSALEALLTKSTTIVATEGEFDKLGSSMRDVWLRLFDSDGKIQPPTQNVSRHIHSNNISNKNNDEPATRLFIAGDRSQVGKSSICLGLLGALLNSGKYKPSDLAYIKPATQCEQTQLVEEYCKHKGIADCVAVGPIVYYKGFTRAFLKGETGETSEQLLQKASDAVDKLALNKKVVIIDGVGYPAVGSITGTDNASVARVCGQSFSLPNTTTATNEERSPVPVLLVGKSGVGDAVDSFNINATYFIHRDVPVIGAVFNKLSLDGFYSLSNCKEAIDMYFNQSQPDRQAFGYIPEISSLKNARERVTNNNTSKEDQLKQALNVADTFVAEFTKHVNVDEIIIAAKKATAKYIEERTTTKSTSQTTSLKRSAEEVDSSSNVPSKHPRITTVASGYKSNNSMNTSSNGFSLTREQIEALASSAGAAGG